MKVSIETINLEKIYQESFGLWISGFFSCISGNCPEITFSEHKKLFFIILERWLQQGKIAFCPPESHLSGEGKPGKCHKLFKNHWPVNATHKDDPDLNYYFYAIPAILWIKPDGTLVGS